MTLGEMLTLDYLDLDIFEHKKFIDLDEKGILDRVHRYQRVFKQHWFVTTDPLKVNKRGWVKDLPADISPRQVLNWSGFYLTESWDTCGNGIYLEQTDKALTELGWELIPPEYYNMEVEGT